MELHPNARVLLSNAPTLLEDANGLSSEICQNYNRDNSCSACNLQHVCFRCKQKGHPVTECESGVLRVSSGNVGSNIFQSHSSDLKTEPTEKYEFRHVSSLIDPPRHSAQAAIKAEHPRRQQHSSWSSPKGPPWYWYVELETPRYQAYREKCRQKGSREEKKWPDRVEEAFQMAIRKYQRRGRKKGDLNGRLAGGNEFISDFIFRTTGIFRSRKQVSSHIQVLKAFLRENLAWMSLVAEIKPENSKKKAHGSIAREEATGIDENSEYDYASGYPSSQASFPPVPSRFSAPIEILASNLDQVPSLRRVSEFAMTLKDKSGSKAVRHYFTSIQSEMPSAPKALGDVNKWREMYPALAAYHDRGPIDCPIFLFDANLSLVKHDYPSTLDIQLSMDFSQGAHYTEWRSYPKFYEENGSPVDLPSWDTLESTHLKGTDNCRLPEVLFCGEFWNRVFSRMVKEEEERATQYIQGISVMQEIWATHRASDRGPQRMAILLWRFNTVKRGEAATTSWRKLLPSLSAYDIQSPHPPTDEPPMTLDTTLQAASPYVAHDNPQPSIFSGCPVGSLLTTPLTEDSSSSTTPTLEGHSFPSSASNSAYPLYPAQESSFHSQDSAYPPLGIFDSELYEHHEVVEASHESYGSHESADCSQESYGSSGVMYHSQDALYQDAFDQLYEYPCHTGDAPVAASASQDFTGGQIHLSYTQTEDSQSSYEAPLIAPQANIIPHHQLIQHLEHFDQHDYVEQNRDDLSSGHHEVDEQAQALPQSYELNGLTIDYSAWEETLRLNPDLERHLSIDGMDEVGNNGEGYMSPMGQGSVEQTHGEVLGEVTQEGGGSPDRQSECQ